MPKTQAATPAAALTFTFLTNHAEVLIGIARNPDARMRDLAAAIGVTERAVQRIVSELEESGCVTATRVGRRNKYAIDRQAKLRSPSLDDFTIRPLLALVGV